MIFTVFDSQKGVNDKEYSIDNYMDRIDSINYDKMLDCF